MINSTLRHVKKVCLIVFKNVYACDCYGICDVLLNCRITEMHTQNREI